MAVRSLPPRSLSNADRPATPVREMTIPFSEHPERARALFTDCPALELLTVRTAEISHETVQNIPLGDPPKTLKAIHWKYGGRRPPTGTAGQDDIKIPDGWIRQGTAMVLEGRRAASREAQSYFEQLFSVVQYFLSRDNWKPELLPLAPNSDGPDVGWNGIRIISDDAKWDISFILEPAGDTLSTLFHRLYCALQPKRIEAEWRTFRNMLLRGPDPQLYWLFEGLGTELTMWWHDDEVDMEATRRDCSCHITVHDLRKVTVMYKPGGSTIRPVPLLIKNWVARFVRRCYHDAGHPDFKKDRKEPQYVYEFVSSSSD